jgi:hypothetical protein
MLKAENRAIKTKLAELLENQEDMPVRRPPHY